VLALVGSYDRIVIEMSGIAEPRNLREEFLEAKSSHQVNRLSAQEM
jgi:G3E family GTPase